MSTLYITKQNTQLTKKGKRIVVTEKNDIAADVPLINVEQVIIIGKVGITGATIQLLLDENIPITYLSYYGHYKGRLVPEQSKNSILRLKQFEGYQDENLKLKISKIIVGAKLKNMKNILLKKSRTASDLEDVQNKAEEIKDLINKLKDADDENQLRGYEGIGSRYYFSQFNKLLNYNFKFNGRNRRPPTDPVNSMLSFGYSLLLNEVLTAISISGLDPYIGFFHSVEYGKPSLALDLMEEFRQPIIDILVKNIINKKIIDEDDFRKDGSKVLFTDESKKIFLQEYERKLEKYVKYNDEKENLSWRKTIQHQIKLFRKTIVNNQKYVPIEVR
jgi:CRISPR-associated protein Cas1